MQTIDFYFSFRSPYAWLAYYRVVRALPELATRLVRIPVFPPPSYANDPAAIPAKLAYIGADVRRLAAAYGLTATPPPSVDTDWIRPHAAWVRAYDDGKADAFALELFAQRFSRGHDVAGDAVLREAANAVGANAAAIVAAADDPAYQGRVMAGMGQALGAGVFGVPTFIHGGEMFWGNDRLEWLLRRLAADNGQPGPDLAANPMARPY